MAAGEKENEINGAPGLLAQLALQGKVVVGDAMHPQRTLSRQLIAAGGDYLWLVKDNQPTRRAEIEHLFTADDRTVLGSRLAPTVRRSHPITTVHGHHKRRTLTASSDLCG